MGSRVPFQRMDTGWPPASSSTSMSGCSAAAGSSPHFSIPAHHGRPGDRLPPPAGLGSGASVSASSDSPHPVRTKRDREAGQLPAEACVPRGLRREQRELLAARRLHERQLQLQTRDGGWGGASSSRARSRRSMASASAVGSGRRCSRRSPVGYHGARTPGRGSRRGVPVPPRDPSPQAGPPTWPRAVAGEADRLQSLAGGSSERPRAIRSGALRGRNARFSSPRARACSSAPSSPNRATSADRGSSATAPIVRRPNRASRDRTSASRVRRRAG